MATKVSLLRWNHPRRNSCPPPNTRELLVSGKIEDMSTSAVSQSKAENPHVDSTSVSMFDIHDPALESPQRRSENKDSFNSLTNNLTSEVQGLQRKTSFPSSVEIHAPPLIQDAFPKNEAEIVDMRERPWSLSSTFVGMVKIGGQGKGKQQKGSSESVDRELRSLYRNGIEDRRLQQAFTELDKQILTGTLDYRHRRNEIDKEHKRLIKTSPNIDEWLGVRTSSLQERQRHDISRRYSRRERHFRAPPKLQEVVAKLKSHAMFEAEGNSSDEEISRKFQSLKTSRRHTVCVSLSTQHY